MTSILKIVDIRNSKDIIAALKDLAEIDNDFNGENGEDYLWESSKKAGYEDNATYLANEVVKTVGESKDKYNFKTYVEKYVDIWIGEDPYYKDYEVNVKKITGVKNLAGKYAISLSVL